MAADVAVQGFGAWLREIRGPQHQATNVALAVGIGRGHYGDIEHGRCIPGVATTVRLARHFGYDPWTVLAAFAILPEDVIEYLLEHAAEHVVE